MMVRSSDTLLPFSLEADTPVREILLLHDAYLKAKGRRRAIEHVLAILASLIAVLYALPRNPPIGLCQSLLLLWVGMAVLFGALGIAEMVLCRRRERLLNSLRR
jgi:hypothetical protein